MFFLCIKGSENKYDLSTLKRDVNVELFDKVKNRFIIVILGIVYLGIFYHVFHTMLLVFEAISLIRF